LEKARAYMSESPDVLAFYQASNLRAAETRLKLVRANCRDYALLDTRYFQNALVSLKWCRDTGRWDLVLKFMNALERFLQLQGHWQAAREHVAYALEAAQQLRDNGALARWRYYAGLVQDELGDYEQAERDYQTSLELARSEGETGLQAEALRRLGWLAQVCGDQSVAEERYRQAIELHRRADDPLGQARDWRQLGILVMQAGEFDQARQHFQSSLDLVEGRTDEDARRVQAGVQLDLGRMALRQDRLQQAQQHLDRALAYAEQAQDRLLMGDVRFYQALLAEKQGDLQAAERKYQERLDLSKLAQDMRGQASSLIALGTLALRWSNYGEARQCYEEALKVGDRHDRAVATIQLGTLAYLQQDYGQAETYLQQALNTFLELNRQQEAAGCHQQFGLVAQATERWQQAAEHYQASLDIRLKCGLLAEAVESLYQLGRLAQQLGQPDLAQGYYQQALDIGERVGSPHLSMVRQALDGLKTSRQ
jgi:tetratricopeptide (TPR) repeat protein